MADISLLVTVNIMVTSLVSFRLIRAHNHFTKSLPNTTHRWYLGIITILIESAAPMAISGLGLIIMIALVKDQVPQSILNAATTFNLFWTITSVCLCLFVASTRSRLIFCF